MRTNRIWLLATIVALTAASASCDASGVAPTRPSELPPLPPDTGSFGLASVPGFPAIELLPDSVVKDSALLARLAMRRKDPLVAAARVMRFTDGIDSQLALGRILTFDVSPTRRLPYTLNSVSEPLSGNKVWRGSLQGGYWGELSLVRGREYLTGGLQIYGPGFAAQYGFEVLGNGYYLVIYIDYRKFPPD